MQGNVEAGTMSKQPKYDAEQRERNRESAKRSRQKKRDADARLECDLIAAYGSVEVLRRQVAELRAELVAAKAKIEELELNATLDSWCREWDMELDRADLSLGLVTSHTRPGSPQSDTQE